jgi:hypothetical protein
MNGKEWGGGKQWHLTVIAIIFCALVCRDHLAAIRSFRAYHTQALTWPGNFRLPRRATAYRHLSQALSTSFKTVGYQIAANGSPTVIE